MKNFLHFVKILICIKKKMNLFVSLIFVTIILIIIGTITIFVVESWENDSQINSWLDALCLQIYSNETNVTVHHTAVKQSIIQLKHDQARL